MTFVRSEMLEAASRREWDMIVIGGGATGLGIAVDGASRGYRVLLLEQSDFGKGTSSRSTKLVHGGVRYLQQGNISLVMEALRERGILRQNAAHLVSDLAFVVPSYDWWESPFYGIGLKVYDMLAGKYGFGASSHLSREKTVEAIPTIETDGLRGGTRYFDAQFDDARLAICLAITAAEQGACVLNYARVTGFTRGSGDLLTGVTWRDGESETDHESIAPVVINATGAFSDTLRAQADPGARPMIRPSQGVHIVLDREFLPGDTAILVPRTHDGRVLFAIPWLDRVVVGTTDTPIESVDLEPRPREEEIAYLLEHAAQYLSRDPTPADVRSVFAGIRPLVSTGSDENTAEISRDHTIHVAGSGLMTVAGGKWTTYRKMAEDAVDQAVILGDLEPQACITERLDIHGCHEHAARFGSLAHYGTDAPIVESIGDDRPLHPRLPVTRAEVIHAARHEMARTVDDVLARRTRALILDAAAAVEAAPEVAQILAEELERSTAWAEQEQIAFGEIASGYMI